MANKYQTGLTFFDSVTIFIISALCLLRAFPTKLIRRMSMQSAFLSVLCSLMVVTVDAEAKNEV